jgi:hypothetical protein
MVSSLLSTNNHTITAITRHDSTATFPPGVLAVPVDYNNEAALISALKGHDFLIITLHARAPPTLHATLVNAGAKAGIPYIMPNVYGFDIANTRLLDDWVFGDVTKGGIADVEASGANYIALCCGFWYDLSLAAGEDFLGFDLEKKKVVLFDEGTTGISSSTLEYCGKAVAALLSLPVLKEDAGKPAIEDWKNKGLYIAGLRVSQRDILESLHRCMGTSDGDWTIIKEGSRERTEKAVEAVKGGDFSRFPVALYTRTFYENGDGDLEVGRELDQGKLGLEREDLDDVTRKVVAGTKKGEGKLDG